MLRRLTFLLLPASLILHAPLAAQDVTAPITWKQHSIKSAVLGTERNYFVSLPANYAAGTTRYPVLILLDANDQPQFVADIANARFLVSRSEVPDLIVVGVPNGTDRTHDLTPPFSGPEARQFPTAGGANAFLKFIADEVLPAVRASYRTVPTTVLAGHSFGGLFALNAAAVRPGFFKGIVAMSPALQVSDTAYAGRYAEQIAKQNVPLRLFVTHGGLEPPIDRGTQRFIARFDSLPHAGVIMQHRRYADATHGLTPLASFVDGLRFVFEPVSLASLLGIVPPPNADSAWVMREAADLERRYREGARSLDLPDILPEVALNQLGYGALQFLKLPGPAVAVFRRNVALYPGSANVYDSLGDGLLAAGDTAGARAAFEKAVEIAKATGHPVLKESEAKLAKLKAAH